MKFQIYVDTQKNYRWRLKASNGEPLASGEGYTTKENCMKAVSLVQSSAAAPVEDLTKVKSAFDTLLSPGMIRPKS